MKTPAFPLGDTPPPDTSASAHAETDGQTASETLTARLREQVLKAQEKLEAGDIKGAEALGKATLQLIRTLEAQIQFEAAQKPQQKKGVTYDASDIARAQDELIRRLDRLAKTLRADEVGPGAS